VTFGTSGVRVGSGRSMHRAVSPRTGPACRVLQADAPSRVDRLVTAAGHEFDVRCCVESSGTALRAGTTSEDDLSHDVGGHTGTPRRLETSVLKKIRRFRPRDRRVRPDARRRFDRRRGDGDRVELVRAEFIAGSTSSSNYRRRPTRTAARRRRERQFPHPLTRPRSAHSSTRP